MSQKSTSKKPTTKSSSTTKKSSTTTKKSATKKPTAKTSTTKKSTAKTTKPTTKKPATTTKKTTTKEPAAKTTTPKKTTTKKKSTAAKKPTTKKLKVVKAIIMSYRRNNRLQTTNQAIAKVLDEYNHKALIGKKFKVKFPETGTTINGTVIGIHGQDKTKQVRLRFNKGGMTAHALNQIAEIQL